MPNILKSAGQEIAKTWALLRALMVKRSVRKSNSKRRRLPWYCPCGDFQEDKCPRYQGHN